ncbi:MAG: HAMP domain-containing protein [Phycisphaerales bacterium]|nr:HAMP domain-containing protein [Phycisphaerales bacterium]
MRKRLGALLGSLELRLLIPLSVVVGAVLALHSLLNFHSTKAHFLGLMRDEVVRSSDLIRRATHDGMLLNRLDEVQATIERLAQAPEVAAIRVYDKRGAIVLSAQAAEYGQTIPIDSGTCRSCHSNGVAKDDAVLARSSLTQPQDGPEVLRHLVVIENEPACSSAECHFHPADRRVLGVLDLEMSMAPFEAAISTSRRQLLTTTIALILISGLVAALFVRRVIHGPAQQLYEGTQRIAAGDLETRIDVRGEHELARLAQAFNRMVEELRSARREITEWSATLEQKVEDKSRELQKAQRQVLHMEKMASLGKLSATVAHELNNPLGGILTYARLVRRELADLRLDEAVRAELDRYLGVIDKESSRCGAIVHNLLTFARRTGAEMERINLNEVVDRSLMLIRHHLEIRNIRLVNEPLDADPQIIADPGQIEQALVALFVNAVEAMQDGAEEVNELAVRVTGEGDWVEILVRDTGSGIDPLDLPHIFEPFFSTKGRKEGGVGLGLAVVYGIVNRHGGQIDVSSIPGEGTTFRLRLPRRPADRERAANPAPAAAREGGEASGAPPPSAPRRSTPAERSIVQ